MHMASHKVDGKEFLSKDGMVVRRMCRDCGFMVMVRSATTRDKETLPTER